MTKTPKLNPSEITAGIEKLPAWKVNKIGNLEAHFKFKTFPEAFSFMVRVAFEAEAMNHHPDWSNTYNQVKIELSTHDAQGLTEKDLELARRISAISWV